MVCGMSTLKEETMDLPTSGGLMRVHLFTPSGGGAFPAVMFFSEIFQVTGPIRRMAAFLAGQGFRVLVPEVYHEYEAAGTVLAYDAVGAERGNELKYTKSTQAWAQDVEAMVAFLREDVECTGRIASFGVCLGGHLALRAAFHEGVSAVAAFYPTDVHGSTLGEGKADDTLARMGEMQAAQMWVFGRQDPHIPTEGRSVIRARLEEVGAEFEWHEFNAAHAFMRDEGPRYDPALARVCEALLLRFLREKIGGGHI